MSSSIELMDIDKLDFEKAGKIFRKASKNGQIKKIDLHYITMLCLSVADRGLVTDPEKRIMLDQAMAAIMGTDPDPDNPYPGKP